MPSSLSTPPPPDVREPCRLPLTARNDPDEWLSGNPLTSSRPPATVAVSAVALEPHHHSAISLLGGIIVPAHRAARRTRRFHVAALGGLTLLAAVGPGAGAAFAAGAGDKNCSDFQYQEDAQEVLDGDTADPNGLDRDDDGVACETLPHRPAINDVSTVDESDTSSEDDSATSTPHSSSGTTWAAADTSDESSTSTRDRDCADFDSQAEAQAVLDDDPSDPERLDADDDGIACESFGYTDEVETVPAAVTEHESAPATQDSTPAYPVGGVEAGDGSAPAGVPDLLTYGLLGSAAVAGAVGARHALAGGRHRRA
jgi:Excalibur calcium-binding domain